MPFWIVCIFLFSKKPSTKNQFCGKWLTSRLVSYELTSLVQAQINTQYMTEISKTTKIYYFLIPGYRETIVLYPVLLAIFCTGAMKLICWLDRKRQMHKIIFWIVCFLVIFIALSCLDTFKYLETKLYFLQKMKFWKCLKLIHV